MPCAVWASEAPMGIAASTKLGICDQPLQHLHPAERAARHRCQAAHAQVAQQSVLQAHHIAHGHLRESAAVGAARGQG